MIDDKRYQEWKENQKKIDDAINNDNRPIKVTVDINNNRFEYFKEN